VKNNIEAFRIILYFSLVIFYVFDFVDNIFATEDISEYLPYYEKLKERLKSIEPIYNV